MTFFVQVISGTPSEIQDKTNNYLRNVNSWHKSPQLNAIVRISDTCIMLVFTATE